MRSAAATVRSGPLSEEPQPWVNIFRSATIVSLVFLFARPEAKEGYTLRVIEQEIPRSRVALRKALHALQAARMVAEERRGTTSVFVTTGPELFPPLISFIQVAESRRAEAVRQRRGMSWARKFLAEPGPRRVVTVGGHRDVEQILDLPPASAENDRSMTTLPSVRFSPPATGRREREGRA